jgi:hypothetical protein
MVHDASQLVMPGLDSGIDASATGAAVRGKDVDGRDKLGHNDHVNRIFVSEHKHLASRNGFKANGLSASVSDSGSLTKSSRHYL